MTRDTLSTSALFRTGLVPQTRGQIQVIQTTLTLAPLIFLAGTLALSLLQVRPRDVAETVAPVLAIMNVALAVFFRRYVSDRGAGSHCL